MIDLIIPGSRRIIRAKFLFIVILFGPVTGFSQGMDAMPEGEGRDLVASQCTVCHGLSTALVKRASREEWEATVGRMINTYMASINESDRRIIVDYLSANFGEGAVVDIGQQTVAEQCFSCHGDGMWRDLKTDHEGWLSVVYRMVGRGGVWTPEQINVIADYLAETYPEGDDQ
jgi:mono/diheme cytochrome c family protein